jgi:uncharacterized protein (AIM24 family)
MEPGTSIITNQESMAYMDGGLMTSATLGGGHTGGGLFDAFLRGITGSSAIQNTVTNPTKNKLDITLAPLMDGSILQVEIKAGETWRFANKSFLACTPNLKVSGDINIFSNFRTAFAGQGLTYTTISSDTKGGDGIVWIAAYGSPERHEITMGTGSTVPLFINSGCFLGMLDRNESINFWNDYVTVDTANDFFSAMFTKLGYLVKIQDTTPPRRNVKTKCVVLTQSLNHHHFERYIKKIAEEMFQ